MAMAEASFILFVAHSSINQRYNSIYTSYSEIKQQKYELTIPPECFVENFN